MNRFFQYIAAFLLAFALVAPAQYGPEVSVGSAWAAQEKVARKSTRKSAGKNAKQGSGQKPQPKAAAAASKKKKAPAPGLAYKGAIVYDLNAKKTLFASRADQQIPPASLTKILAMYVAMDLIQARKISLNANVAVSAKAASMGGSRMGLDRGDVVQLHELLRGMAICSGNDATVAVAEFLGKTEQSFVQAMNRKARALGMNKSIFKNSSGLPAKGQYTTARDMLTLARSYLAAYPKNLAIYHNSQTMTYKGAVRRNANTLLKNFAGADGLKTGYVTAAGYNLISTAKRDNVRLITVLLGAPSSEVREKESRQLLEKGFEKHLALYGKDAKASGQKAPGGKAVKKKSNAKPAVAENKPVAKKKGAGVAQKPAAKPAASGNSPKTTAQKPAAQKTAQKKPDQQPAPKKKTTAQPRPAKDEVKVATSQ